MKQDYKSILQYKYVPLLIALFFAFNSGSFAQVTLGTSPYTQNFNGIAGGLPTGWTVRTGATATVLGTAQTLNTATVSWGTTTGQFANCASANAPSVSTDAAATQATRTDRALAIRQTAAFGDGSAAFVLQISNTTGLTAFNLGFKLMELDPGAAARTATWNIDYGFGAAPASFTNATTVPATLTTTTGTWGTTSVTVNFGSALDNNAGPVWIRLANKSATTGSGNRPVSAIDDFSLSYLAATPTLTAGTLSGFGNICVGATAGPNSFSLNGVNLDGSPVTVGPLAGFSFSSSAGGSYTSTLSPSYTAPNLSTTVFVKFSPVAIQSYNGNIPVSGGNASAISVAASGSGADNAPTVTSGSASSVTAFTAVLAGTITDNGCSGLIDYGVEYSTGNGFANGSGTPVSSTNLGGGNFSSSVSGLSANTVYYYHAYATNSGGTGYGSQQTFTTAQLDAPVATAATGIANHSFDANWNAVTGATGYRLDVATTSTFYAPSTTSVVEWNFPNNPDDNVADGGIALNLSKAINLFGNVTAVTYVPTASGPTSAATTAAGGWASGMDNDYWEVSMVTAGYYNLKVSSAQRSSNTGPRDFKLQYKIGAGGTYTDVPGGTVTVGNDWTTGVLNAITLPAVCENKISVFLRWIMTSNIGVNLAAVGTGGTSAIDNISVIGNAGTFVTGYNNLAVAGLSQTVNTNLTANTTYYYRVRATGATSTSANSNVISLTTTCTAPVISACPADIDQCDNDIATWTDPTATGDPASTVVCSPLSGSSFPVGTSVVTCTATNGCGSPSSCTFNVTINESPVIGACPGDITTCNPVVTFATPSATGTPAPSVTCSPASGSSFAVGTTSVTCTATNSCGSSSCAFNVNVDASSTDPTSASSNALYGQVCLGGSVSLTVSGGTFGLGAGYVWYEGGCGTGGAIGTGSIISVTPLTTGTHTYYVRIEGTCNNTNCVSVSVDVISTPPSGTIHYTSSISDGCVGAPAAAFSVNNIANCTFYRWTSTAAGVRFNGNPSPFETTTPSVNVTFVSLPAAGTSGWSICVFGGNACGNTNTICTWVRATVSAPTSINGSVIGCPGSNANPYSSSLVAGAASYQWSSTGGIVINGNGAQAITVDFPGGFVSGTLTVHGQTACGYNGPNKTININRAPAVPGVISGTSYPCPNASSAYSVTAVPGAANYTWTTSVPGALVTGTTNSCSILFPAAIPAGSSVSVVANSSCPFSSAVRSKGIATGLPGVPASISGPASGQCGQTGVSYSITPVALATGYSWSTTCGTLVGPTNLSGVTVDWPASFTTCTLSVSATNACGTGTARILGVAGAPAMPAAITGNAAPCANTAEFYSTAGSAGATSYIWTVPAGAVILGPANGASILVQWGATSGSITVRGSNTCGNSAVRSLPCVISCRMSQVNASASSFNAEVYPNPASDKATVKFTAATAVQYHMNMTDVLGQNVLSLDGAATEGINMIELNLGSVAKGVYQLSIMSNGNTDQIRIVVQ